MKGRLVFSVLWTLIVYIPLAHWVFDKQGWIVKHRGALGFAGGPPVEPRHRDNSGRAAP